MLYASAAYAVMRCLSVRPSISPSVTFVHSLEMNKHIFNIFSSSSSHNILLFPYRTSRQYSDGSPSTPLTGAWNAGGVCRYRDSELISGFNHRVLSTLRPLGVINTVPPDRGKLVTLIAGSKRRSLLMAGNDDEKFMTRSFNVTPKTTEQHLIARSDKSVAYVTNNKRLRSTFCTTELEANYWQTRSIARPLCDSRATCFMYLETFLSNID